MPSSETQRLWIQPHGYLLRMFACIVSLASLGFVSHAVWAADFEQPEALEPAIAEASSEAEDGLSGIKIRDGWEISLVAAEPDVANIVAFDIDNRGVFYVCESFRQSRGVTDNRAHDEQWLLADLASQTVQDRIDYHKRLLGDAAITYAQHDDRVRRLVDTDGDGRVDQSTILASGFNRIEEGTGASVLARGSDIYYTNIPKLWKLVDKDDDGIADERIVLSDGYGVRVAFRGHDLHGLVIGPDGMLYFSIGDRGYHITTKDGRVLANSESGAVFRCELDGTNLEVVATGMRNPQELAFNDQGDLFSVDNNSDSGDQARIIQVLEGGDSGWRMHYQYLADRGPFNRERIWEPLHTEQPAYIVPPIANFTDGPSGLAYYPGTGFGDQLKDQFLICDFRGGPANSGIRSFRLEADGAYYKVAEDSDPIWTVLATDVAFGPDGALYVSDWVDGWEGLGKGRMYRVCDPKEADTPIVEEVRELLGSDWSAMANTALVDLLSHVDRRVRLEAQWQLALRGDLDSFLKLASDSSAGGLGRLHAVWGAGQIARKDSNARSAVATSLVPILKDNDPVLRAAVAKLLGNYGTVELAPAIATLMADGTPRVVYSAIMALAKLKSDSAYDLVVKQLEVANNQDPVLRHAGVMYLASAVSADKVASLAAHPNPSVRRAAVVALRRTKSDLIAKFLDDSESLVVLEAARAIHDLPLPIVMPSLAALIDKPMSDPELIRRVINANYRLGKQSGADALGRYAANVAAPEAMRIEALDSLANWYEPDPRDRVLNSYRPLSTRLEDEAAKGLEPHINSLMTAKNTIREKTISVAASLGIKKIAPSLVARVSDKDGQASERANALDALAKLDSAKAVELARGVKLLPSSELVLAALKVLAKHDRVGSLKVFIEAADSRDGQVSGLGWDILATVSDPAADAKIAQGVQHYLDGKLSADVHLNVLEAAKDRIAGPLQQALSSHQEQLAQSDPLAPWLASLQGGDPAKGGALFTGKTELSCVRCHKVDRAGGEVGPNLTVIGKAKDRRYLLEAIAIPDAKIAEGFETAVIANDSGQVFTGIVKTEDDEAVTLIQSDGSEVRIYTDEIVARKKGNSSMPSDLTKYMTARELRDLVAYLASLQVDSRAATDTE
ncbi:Cytochrome c [Rubripirellula amarantea]|uniref:Cytochrome c n=1 Tax=Rubripirellula amarantea TaxID=2527999 RepID=A0A5C5WUI9_9BACT|nr:PVC-type heme-binding CxxCH protein [Rubripirellula amarantea]TWT53663.1 Cytochrome c [Rubripirellula amarantea]